MQIVHLIGNIPDPYSVGSYHYKYRLNRRLPHRRSTVDGLTGLDIDSEAELGRCSWLGGAGALEQHAAGW